MQLVPGEAYNVANPSQRLSLAAYREREWHAVAGIGHPERFFLQLEHLGLKIHGHQYPDHYAYVKSDIEFGDAAVMMTEKDAIKCRQFADQRHWCLPVTAQLPEAFCFALLERLRLE